MRKFESVKRHVRFVLRGRLLMIIAMGSVDIIEIRVSMGQRL